MGTTSGTSLSSPYVAGALAILKAQYPWQSCQLLAKRLYLGVEPLPAFQDRCVTNGRMNLYYALNSVTTDMYVDPPAQMYFGMPVGGPIPDNAQTFTVMNFGPTTLQWNAQKMASWLVVSPMEGTLAPNQCVTVTVSIAPGAVSLPQGEYTDQIGFVNLTNGSGTTGRPIYLHVGPMYVKQNGGSDSNTGHSWAQAKATIGAAISAAYPGQEVWVAQGTYSGGLTMRDMVSIYGGFAGTESLKSQRTPGHVSTIQGGTLGFALSFFESAHPWTTIDGCTVTSGSTGNCKGIYCKSATCTISNNVISGNRGGGVICDKSDPVITGNTISGNGRLDGSWLDSSGIYSWLGTVTITGNTITGNMTGSYGGGISLNGEFTSISGNIVSGNTAATGGGMGIIGAWSGAPISRNKVFNNTAPGNGGGIYCSSASVTLSDNVVYGNNGGGIYGEDQGDCAVVNNTVFNNIGYAGIYWGASATVTLDNNIVAFNNQGIFCDPEWGTILVLHKNDVYGNTAGNYVQVAPGQDDISVDPLLVDATNGNWYLTCNSPCIGAGRPDAPGLPQTDYDGQPRVIDLVEIGADEYLTLHVAENGSDYNDGLSWATAKRWIGSAIDAATGPADIWVKESYYPEHLTMKSGVNLYGGFGGTETKREDRNRTLHPTYLCGEGADTVIAWGIGGLSTTIDSFNISNWTQFSRPAIFCDAAELNITNNVISGTAGSGIFGRNGSSVLVADNTITNNSGQMGGGVYIERSATTITGNTFTGNHASYGYGGGAIFLFVVDGLIANNTITGNTVDYWGGGLTCDCCELTISNNLVSGNSAMYAGGMFIVNGCSGDIADNTVKNNTSQCGGGMFLSSVWVNVFNNTISGNSGGGIYGEDQGEDIIYNNTIVDNTGYGGIYWEANGYPVFKNNIIAWNNYGIYNGPFGGEPAYPAIANNDVFGNNVNYYGVSPGPGDIHKNPFFVKRSLGDYHLRGKSACIDAGTNIGAPGTDKDGRIRPIDGDGNGTAICDIGAYERPMELRRALSQCPDGTRVEFPDVAVTGFFTGLDPGGKFWAYVENTDRSAGIRVRTDKTLCVDWLVTVTGIMRTDWTTGERYVDADPNTPQPEGSFNIKPIGMRNQWLGGGATGYEPIIRDGFGFYNIGMLVRSWGRVRSVGTGCFFIDDGSRVRDGEGHIGVRVILPPGASMPALNSYLRITGISCAMQVAGQYVRILRPRNSGDIVTISSWQTGHRYLMSGCWNAFTLPGIAANPAPESVFVACPGSPGMLVEGCLARYDAPSQRWITAYLCPGDLFEDCMHGDAFMMYVPNGWGNCFDYQRTPAVGDQMLSLPVGSETATDFAFVGTPFETSVPWSNCLVTNEGWVGTVPEAVEMGLLLSVQCWNDNQFTWYEVPDLATGAMTPCAAYKFFPTDSNTAIFVPEP